MRTIVAAGTLVLATATLTAGSPGAGAESAAPAQGSAPMCHGKRATIVGTPGDDTIKGTSGADVIVARGGTDDVRSGDGNDTICLGAGDDGLVTGKGADWASGGTGDDNLNNDFAGSNGVDTLLGGTGNDYFFGGPDGGTVRGGDGKDAVAFFQAATGFAVDGGTGRDQIYLAAAGAVTSIAVDAAAGTFSADGGAADVFASWEKVTFIGEAVSSWSYQGTDAAEQLRLMSGSGTLVAHLAGGDDSVHVAVTPSDDPTQPGLVHTLDGGDGTDTAEIDDYELSGSPTPQNCISIENVVTASSGACATP